MRSCISPGQEPTTKRTRLPISLQAVDRLFFFSSRRRHTRFDCDWSSDVCSSDLTKVLGVTVTVERIDMTDDEQIIAICRRGRSLQAIPILDLPLPKPRPAGVEWIEEIGRASCRERV